MDVTNVVSFLNPKNNLELRLITTSDYLAGMNFGKPRLGHPEGQVLYHVREVLNNVDNLDLRCNDFEKIHLRLITLVHDAFKYKVDKSMPLRGQNHHGYLARKYLEDFYSKDSVLKVVEKHDDAYNIWASGNRTGKWENAENRAKELIDSLGVDLRLYLDFYRCDNTTGDKSSIPFEWFSNIAYSVISDNYIKTN